MPLLLDFGVVRLKSGNEISLTLGRLEFQFTGGGFLVSARVVSLLKGKG